MGGKMASSYGQKMKTFIVFVKYNIKYKISWPYCTLRVIHIEQKRMQKRTILSILYQPQVETEH